MTLVVSIGVAILPESVMAAVGGTVAAGTGVAGTAAATTAGALTAGALGAGTVGAVGYGASQMMKGPPKSTPNVPTLAPGLSPAMTASQVNTSAPATPLSGLASIGQQKAPGMAHGGQVPLKNGAYIIPADVVSALGNGSSKAGAEFLRRLMEEVKHNAVGRHGLGAVKRDAA